MITLEVDGVRYDGWTDIKVTRNIETISGSFSFSTTTNDVSVFPVKAQSPCKVYIGNTMVINGYIDCIDVSYDAGSHSISICGRDRTCDLIDGTITGSKEFQNMGLIQIIQKVLANNELSDIQIINQAGDVNQPFPDTDNASSPISQTIFNFLETYARKRQVLLTGDGKGNIVLARSATSQAGVELQNKLDGQFNNIKSATARYDFTKRFYKYVLQSHQSPNDITASDADVSYENIAAQSGVAIDGSIRKSRIAEIISKTSDTNTNLTQLAIWTKNLATARSTEYECTVQGFYQDSAETTPWDINILVKVLDDFANINAMQLIKSVEYSLSVNNGSTTKITCVDPDSYTLELEIPPKTKKANKKGSDIVLNTGAIN